MSLIVDSDEQSPGPAVDQAELLAGQPDRGRVHDGHHLSHVLAHEAVEQVLVAILDKTRCYYTSLYILKEEQDLSS